jgi:hypothetical protein
MKTKTKIIRSFLENNEAKTIKEISQVIKSDYRITHIATQRLLKDKVLLSKKVGSATLCYINTSYHGKEIYLAEEERKQNLFKNQNIKQLYHDLMKKLNNHLFIMTLIKSKTPEINLLFISNEINFKNKVNEILSLIPLHTNATFMTIEEFKKNPPQISTILHNIESYYFLKP